MRWGKGRGLIRKYDRKGFAELILSRRRARGGNERAGRRGLERTKESRRSPSGFRQGAGSPAWNRLKICDVFSIPSQDIRNYCLCFSPSTPYLSPADHPRRIFRTRAVTTTPALTVLKSLISDSSYRLAATLFEPLFSRLPRNRRSLSCVTRVAMKGRLRVAFVERVATNFRESSILLTRCIWFIGRVLHGLLYREISSFPLNFFELLRGANGAGWSGQKKK